MTQKTAQVGFRWRPEVKAALARAAEAEDRSISAQAERIVVEWLRAHGHLPGQRDGAEAQGEGGAMTGEGPPRPTGTGIAGAMDHQPAGAPKAEACFVCGGEFRGGASAAARVLPPLVQVCSAECAADPRFAGPFRRTVIRRRNCGGAG